MVTIIIAFYNDSILASVDVDDLRNVAILSNKNRCMLLLHQRKLYHRYLTATAGIGQK